MRRIAAAVLAIAVSSSVGFTVASARSAPENRATAPIALDDPTIIAIFDGANTADIETGTLATKLGSTKEVRDFGAMLAHDHKSVRTLGRDLATKLNVKPTAPSPDQGTIDHAAAMKHLSTLKGSEFDHAFLQHEVAFHKAVIDAVNSTLLPAIQNAELKALVVKVAPAFQAHMVAAQNLDKQLGTK